MIFNFEIFSFIFGPVFWVGFFDWTWVFIVDAFIENWYVEGDDYLEKLLLGSRLPSVPTVGLE